MLLDTDIGTDVDDLLALILLANEPSVELVGVITVYGDVVLRAQVARRALRLLRRPDVPVHAGQANPQSGRPVWWGGHEGEGFERLEAEEISSVRGVDALISAVAHQPGGVTVVAIGPLTNVAEALDREPSLAGAIRKLVVMGGEFAQGFPEHNVRCDVVAAEKVLQSGIPSLYVGLDVTTMLWLDESDLRAVTASGTEIASVVDRQVRQWWRVRGKTRSHPHDPLAVLAMLEPEQFTVDQGGWQVVQEGHRYGALVASATVPMVEYATRVDVDGSHASLLRRMSCAIAGQRPA